MTTTPSADADSIRDLCARTVRDALLELLWWQLIFDLPRRGAGVEQADGMDRSPEAP